MRAGPACPARAAARLEPALKPRRHPGLLEVEALQHRAGSLVLDVPVIAFGDQRRPLRPQHVEIQRPENLGRNV
ncbi:MAG: hypothetical protein QOH82_4034 [Mycobacterium sp.]|nr:hypothetical protein [Mycobacterium sp.]